MNRIDLEYNTIYPIRKTLVLGFLMLFRKYNFHPDRALELNSIK
jgi:hypothetical protein